MVWRRKVEVGGKLSKYACVTNSDTSTLTFGLKANNYHHEPFRLLVLINLKAMASYQRVFPLLHFSVHPALNENKA